jgi:transcriptional regulator with XRE-family HTH domain
VVCGGVHGGVGPVTFCVFMDSFPRLVERGRLATGLSYQRIGQLVGRSPSTVRDWERGRSAPNDPEIVVSLAAVLALPEDELLASLDLERPAAPPTGTFEDLAPDDDEEDEMLEGSSVGRVAHDAPDGAAPSEAVVVAGSGEVAAEEVLDRTETSPPDTRSVPRGEPPVEVPAADEPGIEAPPSPPAPSTVERFTLPESMDVTAPESAGHRLPSAVHAAVPASRVAARTPIPPRPAVPSPPTVEPSYLEDEREVTTYRIRAVLTVVVGIILLLILEWALHGAGSSLRAALHP